MKRPVSLVFIRSFICLICLWAISAADLSAQEQSEAARAKLRQVEEQIDAADRARAEQLVTAEEAEGEALRLSKELVAIGKRIKAAENDSLRLETRITGLEEQEHSMTAQLERRRIELSNLLSALISLGNTPPAANLLRPGEADKTAQSAAVMGQMIPEIRKQSDALAENLTALEAIRDNLSRDRFALKNTRARLVLEEQDLSRLRKSRQELARKARADVAVSEGKLAKLADEAASLKALLEKLTPRPAPKTENASPLARADGRPPPGFAAETMANAKGTLTLPVEGSIVGRFGDQKNGTNAKGLTIQARRGGQVTAPFTGQIVYAGPYRAYGQILILAHAGGYHSLLTGLGTLFVSPGQWVLGGEPVGSLPKDNQNEALFYLELRNHGRAVDPLPWFKAQQTAAR